jgi:hypothetical protein
MGIPKTQQRIAIWWPSFITASIATIIFFTLFDPLALFPSSEVSRLACYSIGFFCFWGLTASTSLLTCYFQRPCDNKRSTSPPVAHGG